MTQYIDKSAVIEEIDKLQDSAMDEDGNFYSVEAQAEYDILCVLEEYLNTLEVKEETISNEPLISPELLTASADYAREQLANPDYPTYNDEYELLCAFEAGANWQKENLWKDAQGDDLPEIDREVVALIQDYPDDKEHLRIAYAHRPPEYWDGKNILTGEVTRHEPMRYDKGGWNLPNVKYWLDVELPKGE